MAEINLKTRRHIETSVLIKLLHMSLDDYTQHVTETEVRDILIFCYIFFYTTLLSASAQLLLYGKKLKPVYS